MTTSLNSLLRAGHCLTNYWKSWKTQVSLNHDTASLLEIFFFYKNDKVKWKKIPKLVAGTDNTAFKTN